MVLPLHDDNPTTTRPYVTVGLMIGKVTVMKALSGEAPRSRALSTSDQSKLASRAWTMAMTKGCTMTRWLSMTVGRPSPRLVRICVSWASLHCLPQSSAAGSLGIAKNSQNVSALTANSVTSAIAILRTR